MNKPRRSKETTDTVTTVRLDGEKYKDLRVFLIREGLTFREWLDTKVDEELARERRSQMEPVR